MTGALSSADFDGDGRYDIFEARDGEFAPSLWINASPRFVNQARDWGIDDLRWLNAAASADLDGDGRPDLLLHSRNEPGVIVLRNTGARFERVVSLGAQEDFTVMLPTDIDGDGMLDLVAGASARPGDCPRLFISGCPAGVRAWRQRAPWEFEPIRVQAEDRRTQALMWFDLDHDGRDELIAISDFGMINGGNQVLRVERDASGLLLREVPPPAGWDAQIFGMGAAAIDVDRDGRDEVLVTNFGHNVLLQERDGRWEDAAERLGAQSYGVMVGDALRWNDFDPEHSWQGPMATFEARYLDRQSPIAPTTKWTPIVFDFDQDGRSDVYIGAGYTGFDAIFPEPRLQSGALLRGDGTRLVDVTDRARVGELHGAHFPVAADFDGDGDLDLALPRPAFASHPGGVALLRNEASVGRALWIEARGRGGARDGIGARVTVIVGGRTISRRLDGNLSIAGSGPHGVHVGLGARARADSVEVRFVSGAVRRLTNVAAGRVVVREEGS